MHISPVTFDKKYIYAPRIKLLLDAGLLSVFQHNADDDFVTV